MKILFHLGHPAHFHLFKNTIANLKDQGITPIILIKKKDILEDLLKSSGFEYLNILPNGRKNSKIGILIGLLKQDIQVFRIARKNRPKLMVGTSSSITHVGKLLKIPSLHFGEDDIELLPQYARLTFPYATHLIAPEACSVGKYEAKKVPYAAYQKLAYLDPNNFTPSKEIAAKYVDVTEKYFILRTVELNAHHDDNIEGLNAELINRLIELLSKHGTIYISSEIPLDNELEKYRIKIDPIDIHHVMAFAFMYIGDSQSMAVESGVLGVPFIRFNDFVDRIGILREIEHQYQLGFGVKSSEPEKLIEIAQRLLEMENCREVFQDRRKVMLSEKIDLTKLITAMLINYPETIESIKKDPEYQFKFK